MESRCSSKTGLRSETQQRRCPTQWVKWKISEHAVLCGPFIFSCQTLSILMRKGSFKVCSQKRVQHRLLQRHTPPIFFTPSHHPARNEHFHLDPAWLIFVEKSDFFFNHSSTLARLKPVWALSTNCTTGIWKHKPTQLLCYGTKWNTNNYLTRCTRLPWQQKTI